MQADQEIVNRIKSLDAESSFLSDLDGRRRRRLIELLPYELAKPWLKPEVQEADWHRVSLEHLRERCESDLRFAWDKALGHRGISAALMAEVMVDWVWLLCGEADAKRVEAEPYPQYGVPQLVLAGQLLDMNVGLTAEETAMAERMGHGLSCWDGCQEGCER